MRRLEWLLLLDSSSRLQVDGLWPLLYSVLPCSLCVLQLILITRASTLGCLQRLMTPSPWVLNGSLTGQICCIWATYLPNSVPELLSCSGKQPFKDLYLKIPGHTWIAWADPCSLTRNSTKHWWAVALEWTTESLALTLPCPAHYAPSPWLHTCQAVPFWITETSP